MEKTKLLTILVIGLLLINILLVVFFIFTKGPRPMRPNENREIIIDKLQLSKSQIVAYDSLILWHQNEINVSERDINLAKMNLFRSIASNELEVKDSIINRISEMQKFIELAHYQHFMDLKKLCDPSQMQAFSQLMTEVGGLFNASQPKREPKK